MQQIWQWIKNHPSIRWDFIPLDDPELAARFRRNARRNFLHWSVREIIGYFKSRLVSILGILSLVIGLMVLIPGPVPWLFPDSSFPVFMRDIAPELVGIGVTVLLVDWASEQRADEHEKADLVSQLGSPDRAFAREAARRLRIKGWLYGTALNDADLNNVQLPNVDLSFANLRWAKLNDSNLEGANMQYCNLQEAQLENANLKDANLKGAQCQESQFGAANLQNAILRDANLSLSYLLEADMQNANLRGANLQNAKMVRVNLSRASLRDANLKDAILLISNLENSKLWGTNLIGVDLQTVNLKGAQYTSKTIWPKGFDPISAGALLGEIRWPEGSEIEVKLHAILDELGDETSPQWVPVEGPL